MSEAPWSDPLPLGGVPDGCIARVKLVTDGNGGWRLPRDPSRRTRLRDVTVTTLDPNSHSSPMLEDTRLRRFVLGASRRRWATVVAELGDSANTVAAELCRAGDVDLLHRLAHPTQLGTPIGWLRSPRHDPEIAALAKRPKDAADEARRLLEAHATDAWIDEWLEDARRSGLLRRASTPGSDLMTRAARIVSAFPILAGGESLRATELAARYGGPKGAHALDAGHRLTALVLRAAAKIVGAPYPRNAAERRALWAEVGVASDRVSATVLVANFRPAGSELVARQLRERADAALPTHLCALDLASASLLPDGPRDVYVCENPSVLEAALSAGVKETLVSTQGNATTTTLSLLSSLASGGNRIFYRGDFDWPGVAMANHLMNRTGAKPWLFDRETYRVALEDHGVDDLVPLQGRSVEASWDRDLAGVMADAGVAVHEELLVETLVAGLLDRSD